MAPPFGINRAAASRTPLQYAVFVRVNSGSAHWGPTFAAWQERAIQIPGGFKVLNANGQASASVSPFLLGVDSQFGKLHDTQSH